MLALVFSWFDKKLNSYISINKLNKQSRLENHQSTPLTDLQIEVSKDQRWKEAISFVNNVITNYVHEVLENQIKPHVKDVTANICLLESGLDGQYNPETHRININIDSFSLSNLLMLMCNLHEKKIDAQYDHNLFASVNPTKAGVLNHEIYHALSHLLFGNSQRGHPAIGGIHFEARAYSVIARERARGVLSSLENIIDDLLKSYGWNATYLKQLVEDAKILELKEKCVFKCHLE